MLHKPLPIGADNFEQIITSGYYYVDKTLFIKEILDNKAIVNLFTRPRRFGKTLNLSMFRYFFESVQHLNKDNTLLFQGLKIMDAGDKYTSHLGKYPVISLSLKSAKQPTFELAYEELKKRIGEEYARHKDYILEGSLLTNVDKRRYVAIIDRIASESDYLDSLKFLSQCLHQYYNQKVIVLVDEYDTPLENAFFGGEYRGKNQDFYERMVWFIRSLLESALKTNEALEFAVVTGCLRITKESIFTGLNNLDVNSILTEYYGEYFGFLQPEVSKMLSYYERSDKENLVKDWYDGYMFGSSEVYNPWSVLNFIKALRADKNAMPEAYWVNTAFNSIVRELIERADDEARGEIETLMTGKTIEKPVREEVTYEDVYKSQNNLWSFLLFTGYLKKVSERMQGRRKYITLTIPNEEVAYSYETTIASWFEDRVAKKDLSNLYRSLLEGDAEILTNELSQNLQESISFHDSAETFYHGFLMGLLKNMAGYLMLSNRESGKGRYDILVRSPSVRGKAIILELKVVKRFQELEAACDQALSQIVEKGYDTALRRDGFSEANIMKYGIAFYRKDCLVKLG